MIVTLLVFLAIIGVLVFIHELGHFLVARWNGIKVEEFAFGFRPRIWGKKIGETLYAINLIPLGGYVRMYGEDSTIVEPRSFRSKTLFQRFQVLVAGAVMNLLLGWVIMTILFIVGFEPLFPGVGSDPFVHQTQTILITDVAANSPAQTAGLAAGDQLLAVNGQKAATATEFVTLVSAAGDKPVTVQYSHDGATHDAVMSPRVHPPAGQGALGVALDSTGKVKTSPWTAPLAGIYETGRFIGLSVKGFVGFVAELIVKQQVSDNVTGIIGVGALTGVARRLGFSYLMQLVMMVTIGLGVINLMPILPLDGGGIVALLYEKLTKRSLSEKQLGILVTAGLALVILLFISVTYKDIVRFGIFSRF